ncbi:hypothetical protein F5Y09DRAFT_343239 [Xylaria sp. FL1042]|nr:hypothetical protein F5Y09DRAFT_343239 [Xylaria sp. FL1042]
MPFTFNRTNCSIDTDVTDPPTNGCAVEIRCQLRHEKRNEEILLDHVCTFGIHICIMALIFAVLKSGLNKVEPHDMLPSDDDRKMWITSQEQQQQETM